MVDWSKALIILRSNGFCSRTVSTKRFNLSIGAKTLYVLLCQSICPFILMLRSGALQLCPLGYNKSCINESQESIILKCQFSNSQSFNLYDSTETFQLLIKSGLFTCNQILHKEVRANLSQLPVLPELSILLSLS